MDDRRLFSVFFKYILLNVLGQLACSCYTVIDTFFVSAALGADGLTALNLAFPIFCLVNGTGLMIGMGGGIKYSIYLSSQEEEKAEQILINAVYLLGFFSLIYIMAGIRWDEWIARLLGADESVVLLTRTYLQIILVCAPFFMANSLLQCFLRNHGMPSVSAIAMIGGSVSNVVLDYLFIFEFQMGIAGAALATGIAPAVSIGILLIFLQRKKESFCFVLSAPAPKRIWSVISCGIAPFFAELTSGMVMVLFNSIIHRLEGNVGVAAYSIVTVVSLVVAALYTGVSQGMQPLVSQYYGKGNQRYVNTVLRYSMCTVAVLSCLIYFLIYFHASDIVHVFNQENEQVLWYLAVMGLKLYFTACPFIGCNIVLATFFSATEQVLPAQIISVLRSIPILIPTVLLFACIFQMPGVWCAYPVTEGIVAAVGLYLLVNLNRKPQKK